MANIVELEELVEPGVPSRIVFKTSHEIQELIPVITMEDMICASQKELYYLAYLCAKGNIADVRAFLRETDNAHSLLNTPMAHFAGGTILHVALYFNSGQKGLELFDLLTSNGAFPCLSLYCEENPWEQRGTRWLLFMCYIPDEFHRDPSEFTWLYNTIKGRY
jgi:hypothetical protein